MDRSRRATTNQPGVAATSIAAVLALISQACSSEPRSEVVAADGALCDITQKLAGNDVRVTCLLDADAEPHQLQLSPDQIRSLRQADLVLINGYGLTPALSKQPNVVKVAEIAVSNPPRLSKSRGMHQHGDSQEQHTESSGEAPDPHLWHDPRQAAAMAAVVHSKLRALKPEASASLDQRNKAMQASLTALHHWNQQQFNTIPKPRTLASEHLAMPSLSRAYGLNELAVVDAGSSSESLRPQQLATLLSDLRHQNVRILFSEQIHASKTLQRISRLSGIPLSREALLTDHGGANLMATLSRNTCLITTGLGGQCESAQRQLLQQQWDAIGRSTQ